MLAVSALTATAANAASLEVRAADVFATTFAFSSPYLATDTFDFGVGTRLGEEPGSPWTVHLGEFRGMPEDTLRSQWATPWAHATVDTGRTTLITISAELVYIPQQGGKSGAGLSFLATSDGSSYAYAVYRRAAHVVEIGVRIGGDTFILGTVDGVGSHETLNLSVSLTDAGFSVTAGGSTATISFSKFPDLFGSLLQGDPSGSGNTRQGIIADSDNSTRFASFTVAPS
jgi:hypothetical protein